MQTDAARDAVFGDALICEEVRPATFLPQAHDPVLVRRACLRGETLLRAVAIVEDSRVDEPEEHGAADLTLHRIEAKLDLLTSLVATLIQRDQPHDSLRAVQWSARGAILDIGNDSAWQSLLRDDTGVLRIEPSDSLPEALLLPATVLRQDHGPNGPQLWLRFVSLGTGLELALERHLFRVHRRAIHESRRLR